MNVNWMYQIVNIKKIWYKLRTVVPQFFFPISVFRKIFLGLRGFLCRRAVEQTQCLHAFYEQYSYRYRLKYVHFLRFGETHYYLVITTFLRVYTCRSLVNLCDHLSKFIVKVCRICGSLTTPLREAVSEFIYRWRPGPISRLHYKQAHTYSSCWR